MILVRIDGISGTFKVRGYEAFFPVESVDLGAETSIDSKSEKSDRGSQRDFVIKRDREPEEVSISRKVDAITPTLMALAIKSRTLADTVLSNVDVSFIQWRAAAGNLADSKAFLLVRLGGARLVSWSLSGSGDDRPTEDIKIKYKQIALQYRSTEDGITYLPSGTQTWDFEKNAPCDQLVPGDWKG